LCEIGGYAWQPNGAGASVAGAGLLGALLAWLLCRRGLPLRARLGAAARDAGGRRADGHSRHPRPAHLAGAGLAALMIVGRQELRPD
jgi:hypothetical protein